MAKSPPAAQLSADGGRSTPPAPWLRVREEQVADCRVFRVKRRRLRHERDGREGDFYVIEAPDWVHVLPLTAKGEIILVRQWRFGTENLSWEPPGGVMDPGENVLATAQRELLEETGHTGGPPREIAHCAPNPAIQNNHVHFVLMENCARTAALDLDPHEELETGLFPLSEIPAMIRRGEIFHSLALNALQFLFLELDARQNR